MLNLWKNNKNEVDEEYKKTIDKLISGVQLSHRKCYENILHTQLEYNTLQNLDLLDSNTRLKIVKDILDNLLAFHISGVHPVGGSKVDALFLHHNRETSGMDLCYKDIKIKEHVFTIDERTDSSKLSNVVYGISQKLNDDFIKCAIDISERVFCKYKRTDKVISVINEELIKFKDIWHRDATGFIVSSSVLGKMFNAGIVVRFEEPFSIGRGYIAIGTYEENGPMVILNEKTKIDSLLMGYHNTGTDTGIIFNPFILVADIKRITTVNDKTIYHVPSSYAYTTSHQANNLYRYITFNFGDGN